MTLTSVMSYGLGLVGLGMVSFAVAKLSSQNMEYRSARATMLQLLRVNPAQADLVCRASPGTFFEALAAAFKTAAMVNSRDPAIVAQTTKPSYDAAVQTITQARKQLVGKGKMGAGLAVGGAALALSKGVPPVPLIVIAALAALGFGAMFILLNELERVLVLARAEILPEVERAFVDGRYAPPRF